MSSARSRLLNSLALRIFIEYYSICFEGGNGSFQLTISRESKCLGRPTVSKCPDRDRRGVRQGQLPPDLQADRSTTVRLVCNVRESQSGELHLSVPGPSRLGDGCLHSGLESVAFNLSLSADQSYFEGAEERRNNLIIPNPLTDGSRAEVLRNTFTLS